MNWREKNQNNLKFEENKSISKEESINTREVIMNDFDDIQINTLELFKGDTGSLPFETRRALVQLLSGPSLDGRRHAKLWPILMRDEALIRRFLSELFLELVIDHDIQIAFSRQADTEDLEAPKLLRRAQLTFIDSVLLLYLRQKLTQAGSQGERAVVSIEEIIEYLTLFERNNSTDRAGFIKRVYASIEKIKKHHIINKIRGSEDRFEISATLKLLFSAEEITVLMQLYQKMAIDNAPARILETPFESLDIEESNEI